jgi:hypothetical protein
MIVSLCGSKRRQREKALDSLELSRPVSLTFTRRLSSVTWLRWKEGLVVRLTWPFHGKKRLYSVCPPDERDVGALLSLSGLLAGPDARWCNGSTRPFGGQSLGSNPSRAANSTRRGVNPYLAESGRTRIVESALVEEEKA